MRNISPFPEADAPLISEAYVSVKERAILRRVNEFPRSRHFSRQNLARDMQLNYGSSCFLWRSELLCAPCEFGSTAGVRRPPVRIGGSLPYPLGLRRDVESDSDAQVRRVPSALAQNRLPRIRARTPAILRIADMTN